MQRTTSRNPVVTQRMIADTLGLSQFVVSIALRGSNKVAPETSRLILTTAERLGYRVNASARATATGRHGAIALLRSSNLQSMWFPLDLFHGIEDAVERDQRRLFTARFSPEQIEDENYLPQALRELTADGGQVHCAIDKLPRLGALLKRFAIPAIWINSNRERDAICPDDRLAGHLACSMALRVGHRRVLYMPGAIANHSSSTDRLAGVREAIATTPGASLACFDRARNASPRDGASHARLIPILSRGATQRPTVVITYGRPDADLVLHAACEAGLRVPQDLSLVCASLAATEHDNDPIAVDALEIPWREIGEQAYALLQRKIAKPTAPIPRLLVPAVPRPGRTLLPLTVTTRPAR